MKNEKRADAIRKAIVQYLNTDEARTVFSSMKFRENEREFMMQDNIKVCAWEKNQKETTISIQSNTQDGFSEHKVTINV